MSTVWLVEVYDTFVAVNPLAHKNSPAEQEWLRICKEEGLSVIPLHQHVIISDQSPKIEHFEGKHKHNQRCCQKHYICQLHP